MVQSKIDGHANVCSIDHLERKYQYRLLLRMNAKIGAHRIASSPWKVISVRYYDDQNIITTHWTIPAKQADNILPVMSQLNTWFHLKSLGIERNETTDLWGI